MKALVQEIVAPASLSGGVRFGNWIICRRCSKAPRYFRKFRTERAYTEHCDQRHGGEK